MKQKNKYSFHIPHGELLLSSALMFALGMGVALWAGKQPANWLVMVSPSAVVQEELPKEESKETKNQKESIKTESLKPQNHPDTEKEKQEQEIQKASTFHMASVFPEGQQYTSAPSQSYGGQAFAALTEKDSRWISGIYSLSQTSPRELAERIGETANDLPEEWCRISVSFYNGDGEPISGYSNAAEVLSLSSVYSYYHDPEDGEAFMSYAEELWKQSHSYKISISDVYYCDGPCQFSSVKEEEFGDEELAANSFEELAKEDSFEDIEEEKKEQETETPSEAIKNVFAPIGPGAQNLTESSQENETSEHVPTSENVPISIASAAEAVGLSEEELEELLERSGPAGYTAYLESVSVPASDPIPCMGHVDLQVTASIIGINEKKQNLFSVDPIGNAEHVMTENWAGWTELPRRCAKNLEQQDWFEAYGISCSSNMYILNPLTTSEINYYMGMLPEGTSSQRTDVIRQALLSVGSIPYYWGGKPIAPGFEGNDFGTITAPDQKGRTLRGLDCSGWISWVYWSALGERLPQESTSGLSNSGRSIQRSELQPGDLIIRTGDSAHVYLFLAWASDGSMYVIHETGGITNNVTVSKTNVDWPYYRSLFY